MDYINSMEEFTYLLTNEPTLLAYFGTENCSVCHATRPKVDNLTKQYSHIPACYCAADRLPELAGQYLIFTVPALLIFHKGREVFRSARFIDLVKVQEVLNELSGNNENVFDKANNNGNDK